MEAPPAFIVPAQQAPSIRANMPRFKNIAFVASEMKEAEQAGASSSPVTANAAGTGRRHRGARRRRADAADDAPLPEQPHPDLRHEPRLGRLPDERLPRGRLFERLERAEIDVIHPLAHDALRPEGASSTALAINEVSLFRQTYQAAKLRISVDGRVRLDELICDGVLVSTPPAARPIISRRMGRSCRSTRR